MHTTLLFGKRTLKRGVPQHRSILVIDVSGFGRLDNRMQLNLRAVLGASVRAAFRAAGVAWFRLAVEDRGDGMIVLVPARVSKLDLLDPVLPRLTAAVRAYNASAGTTARIRLRVSLHAGEVLRDAAGWVGADVNLACRLVNGEPVYQRLRADDGADVVLVVSDLIYQGVVRHGYREVDPGRFTPVRVLAKEVDVTAWLRTA